MLNIYHNPRCRKSREALSLLENSGTPHEVILYLKEPPTPNELRALIQLLGIPPIDLVRKNEALWKDNYKQQEWSDEKLIQLLTDHPKLIERPLIFTDKRAVIGRPIENLQTLLKQLDQ